MCVGFLTMTDAAKKAIDEVGPDTVAVLAQLGRFDLVALLLAAIGLILVAGGVFAFVNFRSIAKKHVIEEARSVAAAEAAIIANEYLQRELPELLKEYSEFFGQTKTSADAANEMAAAQEDPK